jgi:hypothetical protein
VALTINELLDGMSDQTHDQLASATVTVHPRAPRGTLDVHTRERAAGVDVPDPAVVAAVTSPVSRVVVRGGVTEMRTFRVLAADLGFVPTRSSRVVDELGVGRDVSRVTPDLDGREYVLETTRGPA